MSELRVEFDWESPEGARGPELRATWARLTLRVDGEPVTRILDEKSRTVREHVYAPLYPLAEWIATHWWPLLHEVGRGEGTSPAFLERHSLVAAREGYAFPSLSVFSLGETIRVEWEQVRLPLHKVEFLCRGSRLVNAEELKAVLSDFIEAVVLRLKELDIRETLLEQEWRSIQSTMPEEREFCLAAAALGLDPYGLDETERETIVRAGEALEPAIWPDFFAVADAERLSQEAQAVADALDLGTRNTEDLPSLKELREELRGSIETQASRLPWQAGYEAARRARRILGLNGQPITSMDRLSEALRAPSEGFRRAFLQQPLSGRRIDAVVGVNQCHSPGIVLRAGSEAATRFHLCRGLFEFFTSPTLGPALVTRARSDRQKRSRAFAAEFLAPAEALRARIAGEEIGREEVDDLAVLFGVQTWVVTHQLENHRIAAVAAD